MYAGFRNTYTHIYAYVFTYVRTYTVAYRNQIYFEEGFGGPDFSHQSVERGLIKMLTEYRVKSVFT